MDSKEKTIESIFGKGESNGLFPAWCDYPKR